jgi:hypothetical protein
MGKLAAFSAMNRRSSAFIGGFKIIPAQSRRRSVEMIRIL